MTHGLVIGKFLPPHAGHHHLIDTALASTDRVTVLAIASSDEPIPVALRGAWLRERHPGARVVTAVDDTPIDYDDPAVWDRHEAVWRRLCPEPVDVVFSSESYGDELARRMGARHVLVDGDRVAFPISGTAVRADPAAHWASLEPGVRAWFTVRVAVVGAESTGTTTLAQALAAHYGTEWVPEYGRAVTLERARDTPMDAIVWTDADFERIARRQLADEDAAARRAGPVLICDTNALATCVWQERYLGHCTIEAIAAPRAYALHILTADDIPFVQDGIRDGEHLRGWMTARFRERLAGTQWIEVRGDPEARLRTAVDAIDNMLRPA